MKKPILSLLAVLLIIVGIVSLIDGRRPAPSPAPAERPLVSGKFPAPTPSPSPTSQPNLDSSTGTTDRRSLEEPTGERATTPWLELRQGVRAYIGDDAEGPHTLTVCPSVYFYKKWFASLTAVVPECTQKPRGTSVTITSNEIFLLDKDSDFYAVSIKADDSSWSGWANSFGLQPRIPVNTKVVVKSLAPDGEKWFFPNRTSSAGHIVLHNGATLQILSQDPKSGDAPDLYGQMIGISGDAGKKGWLHRLGLYVQGDGPLLFAQPSGTKPQQ